MEEKQKSKTIKHKIGIWLIILSFVSPILGFIIPFLGFSKVLTTTIVTITMVGAPEIFLILGSVLAGKEGVSLVTHKVKKTFGIPTGRFPASKIQYNFALALIVLWGLSFILPSYIPQLSQLLELEKFKWYYSLIADIVFVTSILFIGGNQLITKLFNVFTYEKWKLPPQKQQKY